MPRLRVCVHAACYYAAAVAREPFFGRRHLDDGSKEVDESLVNQLLADRKQAKYSRDYETADRLRDELKAMDIDIYDKDRTWRVRW